MKKYLACILILLLGISIPLSSAQAGSLTLPPTNVPTLQPITEENLIPLYFDLLDYLRTQALGRTFRTSQAERQRVSNMLIPNWWNLDAATQETLLAMAETAQTIKTSFEKLNAEDRKQVLAEWKQIVLSPQWLYPPMQNMATYQNGAFSFGFPSNWKYAEGNGFMYLGPSLDSTWEQVNSANTTPPGMLLMAFNNDLTGQSYLEVARMAANSYVNGLQEIISFGSQSGAIVVVSGRFPNQSEEKFFWMALVPAGNLLLLARMGGPVAQADTLVPAFYAILNSMNWSGSASGGDSGYTKGEAGYAFDAAWGRVSGAIVSNIWAK
jgi:hypothetical protein